MRSELTVFDLAAAVDKDAGYVRQHIHRGHLKASKDESGRVVIAKDEAHRWARERGLPFMGEAYTTSGVTHALIMPFPVINLVTWCGHRADSRGVRDDFIADSPEAVTCQRCMEVMREAHANLSKWIPKLSVKEL